VNERVPQKAGAAACCAEFYEREVVHQLLSDSFHPGGIDLSRRAFEQLRLPSDAHVLDVACGIGSTSRDLADRYQVSLVGVDFSRQNVEVARSRTAGAAVEYEVADVQCLPFADESFDAVVCECAVSTFADKERAAAEMSRVLRPGGQLVISDMAVESALPKDLLEALGPWACVTDALAVDGYRELFAGHGLGHCETVDESETLEALALEVKRRLAMLALGQLSGALADLDVSLAELRSLIARARAEVEKGALAYFRMRLSKGPVVHAAAPRRRETSSGCDPGPGCC
jgi:hypothetical protein